MEVLLRAVDSFNGVQSLCPFNSVLAVEANMLLQGLLGCIFDTLLNCTKVDHAFMKHFPPFLKSFNVFYLCIIYIFCKIYIRKWVYLYSIS